MELQSKTRMDKSPKQAPGLRRHSAEQPNPAVYNLTKRYSNNFSSGWIISISNIGFRQVEIAAFRVLLAYLCACVSFPCFKYLVNFIDITLKLDLVVKMS